MTSLPFFSSSLPFGFQAHSFLPRPRESGGHHLYRCLGIKAPWPLLLRGGLGQRWLGQRGEGQGRAALCSSQQSGLQFPQTWELTGGPPQHDSDEVMFTRALTHAFKGPAFTHKHGHTQV